MATFKDFNFVDSLNEALHFMGFEEPTPIQQQAIPIIQDSKDLIACAQTGTGKTAAFLLPILNKIANNPAKEGYINTLVLAPTRELALQIDQQVEAFGYFLGISSLPVYGGGTSNSWDQQKKALSKGADMIIATPGRLIAHLNMGYVKLEDLQHLILDEADRMLDMGFYEDIMSVVRKLPNNRQNLLFSATMPPKIRKLANSILQNPLQINIAMSKPAEGVLQGAYMTYDHQKLSLIEHLLSDKNNYPSVIIFSSTRRMVKTITDSLKKKGFPTDMISSDLEQKEREKALQSFKAKNTQILVATDILARGIDIKEISLVINYDVPQDAEDYVHRVGRTARADSTGVALTFITEKDQHKFHNIEQLIEQEVRKIPLPPDLGKGPEYNPNKRGGGRGRGGRGGSGGGGRNRSRGRGGRGKWNNSKKKGNRGRNNNSSGNNNKSGSASRNHKKRD
ncbi:MAG: DEAD/DEAH box helicase [Bacteroidota bacterium]